MLGNTKYSLYLLITHIQFYFIHTVYFNHNIVTAALKFIHVFQLICTLHLPLLYIYIFFYYFSVFCMYIEYKYTIYVCIYL